MKAFILFIMVLFSQLSFAQQLDLDFGEHPTEVLRQTHFFSKNIQVTSAVPEKIKKIWYYRDFGFEIADGYYGYGPTAYYNVFDSKRKLIGYMMAQTLFYSEDPELHIAYTVCDLKGNTVIELSYDVYGNDEVEALPIELRPSPDDLE